MSELSIFAGLDKGLNLVAKKNQNQNKQKSLLTYSQF